jgi:hypothetical protein
MEPLVLGTDPDFAHDPDPSITNKKWFIPYVW